MHCIDILHNLDLLKIIRVICISVCSNVDQRVTQQHNI